MNTYELLKNLVGCTITEREDGVIEIAPSVKNDISETIKDSDVSELSKFKEGDFLYFEGYGYTWYLILKNANSNRVTAHWSLDSTGKIINKIHKFCEADDASYLKRATPEQENVILKALRNEHKVWNPNTRQIEDSGICRGDFVYCEDTEISKKWVAIVDSVRDGGVYAEAMYIWNSEKNAIWVERSRLCDATDKTLRRATEEEKQMLLDALHDERKIWNPDTKQIEEDCTPRIGDLCVFWDEDNARNLIVGKLHMLQEHGVRYSTENFGAFECCVRFQDFDFETMQPKY